MLNEPTPIPNFIDECIFPALFFVIPSNLSSSLLLMEFPFAIVDGEAPTPLIFGASFARGTYDGHSSVTLLHFPAESTEETVFMFKLTEDRTGVDVLREQLTVSVGVGWTGEGPGALVVVGGVGSGGRGRRSDESNIVYSSKFTLYSSPVPCWLFHLPPAPPFEVQLKVSFFALSLFAFFFAAHGDISTRPQQNKQADFLYQVHSEENMSDAKSRLSSTLI